MSDLDFLEKSLIRSGYRARYTSPDSVISTFESNFSLFSSTSASVDRCSFASDGLDHDSLASTPSLHLAVDDEIENTFSGQDPDPNKAMTVQKNSCFSTKGEKVKVHVENENQFVDSAYSFSLAIKECQDRKIRSNALLKNNVSALSPRLGNMNRLAVPKWKSGEFTSPGTAGMQKGLSSERVPLHNNGGRRQGNASVGVLQFNNGKALPSKWEDAERWIFSPVSGDVGVRQSVMPHHRRPKSKSGPLGPFVTAYNSLYSPTMHMFDGGHTGNFMAVSPFSAGVNATNDLMTVHSRSLASGFSVPTEPCMARSVSVHGCSEVGNPPLLPSQDEKHDAIKDEVFDISHSASRRDAATQMSPESSTHSSPSTPSALRIMELQSFHSSKAEVRDVQVDERVTMTRWSKKHRTRNTGKSTEIVDDWRKREVDTPTSSWDVTDATKHISKVKREEAKITAWENLQKAKAEAAMRKLEMKLEKKRSSSMDKIMNKLRSAQKRAQEMRSLILANRTHQVTMSPLKAISFHRTRQMGSLSGCFTCHAF